MTTDGTARHEFSQALQSALREATPDGAAKPTLAKIVNTAQARGRTRLTPSAVNAWMNGKRLPTSWAAVDSFLGALEQLGSLPRGKFHRPDWERLYKRAKDEPTPARTPRVATLRVHEADPLELKVHPARITKSGNTVPSYIPRDVDEAVRTTLSRVCEDGGFVLLTGASTAGKTRCAYEAMVTTLPDHLLIVPQHVTEIPDAITAAVQAGKVGTPHVLWLNDMEQFLGLGGLGLPEIRALRSARTVVLGTMRSRIREGMPSNEAIRLSQEFDVKRMWSPQELERARLQFRSGRDERLRLALSQAENFGVAETLATGPQLWRELNAASVVDGHPRGAALVWAAIDLSLAGLMDPLSQEVLRELHEDYLPGSNKQLIGPEPWDSALEWATSPRDAVTRLLIPEGDGVRPFDYLLDAHLREHRPSPSLIPEKIWGMALASGTEAHQRFDIALASHANDRMDIARRSLLPLVDQGDIDALRTLGLLYERTDKAEAAHWLQLAIDAGDVLSIRLMGNLHFRQRDRQSALDWYWQAAQEGDEVASSYFNGPGLDHRAIPEGMRPAAPSDPAAPSPTDEDDWDDDAYYGPTVRTLRVLEAAFDTVADRAYDSLEEVGDRRVDLGDHYASVFSDLPVLTWGQQASWRRQMARCFDDLANDIRAGDEPRPTCTGEEMALHLALEYASSMVIDESESVSALVKDLPASHDDYDWDLCIAVLLEDTDVLFLYEPWSQGIEDSDSIAHQFLGIANLEAADWFEPFYRGSGRDPDRGFRR